VPVVDPTAHSRNCLRRSSDGTALLGRAGGLGVSIRIDVENCSQQSSGNRPVPGTLSQVLGLDRRKSVGSTLLVLTV
jgi:hypothetical protein